MKKFYVTMTLLVNDQTVCNNVDWVYQAVYKELELDEHEMLLSFNAEELKVTGVEYVDKAKEVRL